MARLRAHSGRVDGSVRKCHAGSLQHVHRPAMAMTAPNGRALLTAMFDEVVVRKDASKIPSFYHPEFVMVSNGITQDYEAFTASHEGVYDTDIHYSVDYDNDAWVVQRDRIAARVWVTTSRPSSPPNQIEVMLIATLKEGRLHRLWELTFPDWSALPEFASYGPNSTSPSAL